MCSSFFRFVNCHWQVVFKPGRRAALRYYPSSPSVDSSDFCRFTLFLLDDSSSCFYFSSTRIEDCRRIIFTKWHLLSPAGRTAGAVMPSERVGGMPLTWGGGVRGRRGPELLITKWHCNCDPPQGCGSSPSASPYRSPPRSRWYVVRLQGALTPELRWSSCGGLSGLRITRWQGKCAWKDKQTQRLRCR